MEDGIPLINSNFIQNRNLPFYEQFLRSEYHFITIIIQMVIFNTELDLHHNLNYRLNTLILKILRCIQDIFNCFRIHFLQQNMQRVGEIVRIFT